MRVAFPLSTTAGSTSPVLANDFNSTSLVGAYNTENERYKFWNTSEKNFTRNFFAFMEQENINAIVSASMQILTLKQFREKNVMVFKSVSDDLDENLELLKLNKLDPLQISDIIRNFSNCESECSTCSGGCNA